MDHKVSRTAAATEACLALGALRRARDPRQLDRARRTVAVGLAAGVLTLSDLLADVGVLPDIGQFDTPIRM